jgi:osmoprotectant transport system ATP-binding protein
MNETKAAENAVIEFRHVCYEIEGGRELLHDVNLQVHGGETLILLGKSGSGKTTTLKLINHLLTSTGGDLTVEGKLTREWDVIRLRRRIGYVIQEIGLFPHFTVARNIGVVPQIENWPRERIAQRVRELLEVVGLSPEFATRYPHELSGGQRQRVGVARALAADPPILLMDEPFGALDPITRAELQREFQALQQRLRKTVVFVTHDLREALVLGTRIALMEDGRMLATLTPEEFLSSSLPQVTAYLQSFDLPRRLAGKTPESLRSHRL